MKQYYNGINRGSFVASMVSLFNIDNGEYNHSEMIHKLSICPTKLTNCVEKTQYMLLLEEIYNYRRREKIYFRLRK